MTIHEQILSAWTTAQVDRYASKKSMHGQPSLFQSEKQDEFAGLGPGRWITIGSEKGGDGEHHGGHRVFVGTDGKMKTGKFAGKTMQQAFGTRVKQKPKAKKQKLGQGKFFATEDQENLPGFAPGESPKKPVSLETIPLRQRKSVARELASDGKSESEIAAHLVERGVARKDAAALAENATQPAEKPALAVESRANADAKPGDQTGLFGEVNNAPQGTTKLTEDGETRGKQSALFDTKGDPDQGMLFNDGIDSGPMKTAEEQVKGKDERNAEKQEALSATGKGGVSHSLDRPKNSIFPERWAKSRYIPNDASISMKAFKGADAIWYHQGDTQMLAWGAAEGQKSKAAELEAARKAGYTKRNHRAGKYGTVWVMEKDGKVLTKRGAEALASGRGSVEQPAAPEPKGEKTPKELIRKAHGHEDNESTQAARRLLKRRFGIDWQDTTKEPTAAKPETKSEQAGSETHAPGLSDDIIPYKAAYEAHRGTSHVPETRAKSRQREFVSAMNADYKQFRDSADGDPDKLKSLDEQWPRYLERSKAAYLAALAADSRTMSSMITGPARFPVASNRKKMDTAMKRWEEFTEGRKKGRKAIQKRMHPEDAPRKIGDKDTGSHIETKIEELQTKQDMMKSANAALRKVIDVRASSGGVPGSRPEIKYRKGHDEASAIKHVTEATGLREKTVRKLMQHDFAGRLGYPSYELTNNNANLKRYKSQLQRQQRFESEAASAEEGVKSHGFDGGQVHLNYEENRLQIAHDSKPDRETIAKLKKRGFRWSPRNKAWQRQLTQDAKSAAKDIVGVDLYAAKSDAQREAGNYKMKHIRIHGLDISIETLKGERRRPEWPPMPCDYGYIKRTRGRDGDHVDVFLAVSPRSRTFSDLVVVVDQATADGAFDEHKVILGAATVDDAVECYKKAYTKGWVVGSVTAMTIQQFKNWLSDGSQRKPLRPQVSKYSREHYSAALRRDDLVLCEDAPVVDKYDWRAQPRAPKGNSKGGQWTGDGRSSSGAKATVKAEQVRTGNQQVRSSKREIAEHPDTVKPGHALHHSSLSENWQKKLLSWNSDMSKMLRAIGMRGHGAEVAGLDREKAEEQAWQEVDKSKVREMLEQMNEWNREANAEGVALHEFVNANKIIPRDLATRLASGRKFFDPEMLGDKLKGENASSPQRAAAPKPKQDPAKLNAWKSASESEKRRLKTSPDMASAIAAAMGISANPAETKAESSPSAAEQRAPQRASIDGLTRQAESKLRNELEGVFGIANPEHQNQLGGMIADVWKNLARETEERNDALRQLTGHFGKGLGATVANIRKGVDTSKIAGFDELVDHAVSEYPHLVSRIAGDSDTGSHEEALAEAIRAGIQKVPQPWSQQVFDRVEQLAGPSVFDPQAMEVDQALAGVQEDEPIPFSAKSDFARAVARYWAQAESLLHS